MQPLFPTVTTARLVFQLVISLDFLLGSQFCNDMSKAEVKLSGLQETSVKHKYFLILLSIVDCERSISRLFEIKEFQVT